MAKGKGDKENDRNNDKRNCYPRFGQEFCSKRRTHRGKLLFLHTPECAELCKQRVSLVVGQVALAQYVARSIRGLYAHLAEIKRPYCLAHHLGLWSAFWIDNLKKRAASEVNARL